VLLCALILGCMIYELVVSNPDWALVGRGLLPSGTIFTNTAALYAGHRYPGSHRHASQPVPTLQLDTDPGL